MLKGIFLVTGHGLTNTGLKDEGALGKGVTEYKQVEKLAKDLSQQIKQEPELKEIEVVSVGLDARLTPNQKIVQISSVLQKKGWGIADALVLELHIHLTKGLKAYCSQESFTAAQALLNSVNNVTNIPAAQPGINKSQEEPGVAESVSCLGVIFEVGLILNEFNLEYLEQHKINELIAKGFCQGLLKIIGKGPKEPKPDSLPVTFKDISSDDWFGGDVELCLKEGLLQESDDGKFNPEKPLTRAEFAAVVARHLRKHHGIS